MKHSVLILLISGLLLGGCASTTTIDDYRPTTELIEISSEEKVAILGLIALVVLTWGLVMGSLIRVVLSAEERQAAGPDRSKNAPILMVSLAATLLPKKTSINATTMAASRFIRFILPSSFSIKMQLLWHSIE